MSDEDVIYSVAASISSEQWWKPLLGFMATNCNKFNSGKEHTNEEYQCFLEFRTLMCDLFDSFVARQVQQSVGARPTQIEQIFLSDSSKKNRRCMAILDILKNMSDFETFKSQMVQQTAKIDEEVTNMMLNFHMQQSQAGEDGPEVDVAQMLEKGEEMALIAQTKQMVENMKSILNVENTSAQKCGTPRPLDGKRAPSLSSFNNTMAVPRANVPLNQKDVVSPQCKQRGSSPCIPTRPLIMRPSVRK